MVPQQVSFVERLSLSQRVPYRRFHCTHYILSVLYVFCGVCVRVYVCVNVQSVLSVFRSLSTLEKTVDYFSLSINCKLSKLVFIFHCRHGTYALQWNL